MRPGGIDELDTNEERIQDRHEAASDPTPTTARSSPLVIVAVGLAMLVVGTMTGYFGRPLVTPQPVEATPGVSVDTPEPNVVSDTNNASPSQENPSAETVMAAIVVETRHFKGNPDAPVTIVEFSDFRCPYCGRFATGAGREIEKRYVEEGLVRFGYQHFAILGPESQRAAEASECAAEQDAFWAYHDLLFERQAGVNAESLRQFATELGLDTEVFDACLDSGKYTSLVRSETAAVQSLGVTGTPSFLINGQPLVGAQPFEVFQQVIEAELGAN
jgi:protein-disulfide isomerase